MWLPTTCRYCCSPQWLLNITTQDCIQTSLSNIQLDCKLWAELRGGGLRSRICYCLYVWLPLQFSWLRCIQWSRYGLCVRCRMWRKEFPLCTQVGWSDKCCPSYNSFSLWILWAEVLGVLPPVHCWVSLARVQAAAISIAEGCESGLSPRQWVVSVCRHW